MNNELFKNEDAVARAKKASQSRDFDKVRGFNPCTTNKKFDYDETEFLMAMDSFKTTTGKKFPTWSEVLGVIKDLGYQKVGRNA